MLVSRAKTGKKQPSDMATFKVGLIIRINGFREEILFFYCFKGVQK